MRPFLNLQRTMSSRQFSMQVFVVITIAALASVASSECFDQETGSSADFEFICSKSELSAFYDNETGYKANYLYEIRIICHNNDWTNWPDVKLNLSSVDATVDIQFAHCNFPASVNVQNILNSMQLPVIRKIEFEYLKGMLDRESLKGLSVTDFHLVDSNFKGLPFDLMYDVVNVSSFLSNNNKLMDIPDSFFGNWAKNLTRVNLQHNKLRKIKRNDFSQLVNLTTLDLAHNEIEEIEPAAFDELVNLQNIHLSFNRLRTLPIGVFQRNIRLKSINLGWNCLDELAQDLLANSKLLEEFSMSGNNSTLSTLPDMFFGNLSSLQVVFLIDSQLESLPSNLFTGCTNITSISLSENKLTTLPSGLFNDTKKLEYLRISNNRLETLPPHIFSKLHRLYHLHLGTNRLTSLMPEVLEGLQSVLEFDASHNNITRIDDQFLHFLKSAHLIDLSHNQITFESHQHKVMPQDLEESSLINTPKNEDKPVVIDGTTYYGRFLKLKFNNIKELNADVIQFLKYVHYLDLSGNLISQINLSVLPVEDMRWNITLDNGKVETSYKQIMLWRNPFHCDCNMKDFVSQLKGENGTELKEMLPGIYYICASPPQMKGQLLKFLSPDQFNCLPSTSDPPRVQAIE